MQASIIKIHVWCACFEKFVKPLLDSINKIILSMNTCDTFVLRVKLEGDKEDKTQEIYSGSVF